MKTSEVLIKARDYLMEHGLCKGTFEDDEGHVCAQGAVCRATDSVLLSIEVPGKKHFMGGVSAGAVNAINVLNECCGYRFVFTFNDNPSTTFNDVIDLFDRAIIKAKEMEA